jgi:hypothetical protein
MKHKTQRCAQRKREETTITTKTTKTIATILAITLKEEEEKNFEAGEKFKQEYFFNEKQRIRLSLPSQRESAHDLSSASQTSLGQIPDDYRKQMCEFLNQSEFSGRDSRSILDFDNNHSLCEAYFIFNDEKRLKNYDSQHIYLNINILNIPIDILGIIITFTDIIEVHVLRFVNKNLHRIVHFIVGSNLLSPKKFCEYDVGFAHTSSGLCPDDPSEARTSWRQSRHDYHHLAAGLGYILLFDCVMFSFDESIIFQSHALNIAARNGNLDLIKHMKKCYNYKWHAETCYEAAEGGHLEILKWLKEDGCPCKKKICERAAWGGRASASFWNIKMG